MRVRTPGRILLSALIALAAFVVVDPRAAPASDETRSNPQRDAIPGEPHIAQGSFSSVVISSLEVGFTKEFLASGDQREHRIRGADVKRMQQHYQEVVSSKLATDYTISEAPGPGVVRLDAFLIDHVLDKRDWLATESSFRSAPRVRVVVFLRDSRSDELVDTVGLTLGPRSSRLMKDSPGFYWHYMRRVFDRIATRVRWALENQAAES